MPQCIAVVNQKGGSGKSSTAVALAYWLNFKMRSRAILIDSDAQKSSSMWISAMATEIPFKIISDADSLIEQFERESKSFDFVVIDGPGSLAEVTRAIVLLADLAIIPCQPTGLDLGSASETVRLILQARAIRKTMPKAAAFLSRAVKGTRLKDEARTLLSSMSGIEVLQSVIHQRQAVADSVGQQTVVFELRDRASAESSREYHNLFTEVLACLENH